MSVSRLSIAIADGLVDLPAQGRIAVFRPKANTDLGALPKDRVHVIQGFWPDHQAFVAQGFETGTEPVGEYAAAIIFVPRAKAEARALVAQAAKITGGGPVIIDGQKTDGVESILKDCKKRNAIISGAYSKAHGRTFTVTGGDFSDWMADQNETQLGDGFVTVPGIFSADAIDKGSAILVAALPEKIAGRVCDLGAGWGYLSAEVLKHPEVTECHLIEAEQAALQAARRNITDPRAVFHWADATNAHIDGGFDIIVCNPPFHTMRSAEPSLGQAFIAAAARLLKGHGTLWLVANRHLPYEAALSEAFREVVETAGDSSFKVFRASKPRHGARKNA